MNHPQTARRWSMVPRPALLLVLATITGCSGESGPARFDVSGRVTYGGKLVPVGQIQFEPDASQGNHGPAGIAPIENGSYDTAKAGCGHVGGPHRVLIVGYDGVTDPDNELVHGQPLFEPYRTTVDLPREAVVRDFAIVADDPKLCNFAHPAPPPFFRFLPFRLEFSRNL